MQTTNREVKKIESNSLLITAAKYAYEKFFSKAYALEPAETFPRPGSVPGHIKGIVIQRPNHALAHSIRTMLYIPSVIKAYQCKHPNAKMEFDIENMQLLILFFVVGRESEASFKDDNVNYLRFKQNSAEAYKKFVLAYQESFPSLKSLVKSGQVDYYKSFMLHSVEGDDGVSKIFTMAHNLDLMRCYGEQEFGNTRKVIIKLLGFKESEASGEEIADSLIRYAKSCLVANGDKILAYKIDRNPELFVQTSIDVNACLATLRNTHEPVFGVHKDNNHTPAITKAQKPIANLDHHNHGETKAISTNFQKGLQYEAQKKYVDAYDCFYAEAQKNDANAQYKVGLYRFKGLIGKQDPEGAKKYFDLAAKQGHKEAASALHQIPKPSHDIPKPVAQQAHNNHEMFKTADTEYQKGLQYEAQKKYVEAYHCFYAEAQKNDANAQYKVGVYRYKGLTGTQDTEGAKKYFDLAAKQGHKEAASALQQFQKTQTPKTQHKK